MIKKHKFTKYAYINMALLLVIVALAAVVTVLLVGRAKDNGSTNEIQKYYDNKVFSYRIQNTNLAKGQIVFIGDSITDLYVLDDHYADLELACYNRGIGGDTTSGVLKRLQESVFDLEPSAVVLMIGTNDVNGNLPENEILDRYSQIVKAITTTLPNTKLYCVSVIPQNKQLEEYSQIKVDHTTEVILRLNPQICQIALSSGAVYIDLFAHLSDSDNYLLTQYSDDGIHLNEKGLAVWTEQMRPFLISSN